MITTPSRRWTRPKRTSLRNAALAPGAVTANPPLDEAAITACGEATAPLTAELTEIAAQAKRLRRDGRSQALARGVTPDVRCASRY